MRGRPGAALVLAIGVAAGAPGCSSDDANGADRAGLGSITAALSTLPAEAAEGSVVVAYGDLAEAAEIAGVETPDRSADPAAVVEYLLAITGGPIGEAPDESTASPVAALTPEAAHVEQAPTQLDAFTDEVGWNILHVDRFAELRTRPSVVTVLDGRFEEGPLREALGTPDHGVWVVGDPTGQVDPADASPARPLGEPLWLSLDGDRLVVTRSASDLDEARAVAAGDGPSLADDEVLAVLAAALDEADAYTALLERRGGAGGRVGAGSPCEEGLAEAPTGAAAGLADHDGPVVVIVLAHDDPDSARSNAEALRRVAENGASRSGEPWNAVLTVEAIDTAGPVVTARLRPAENYPAANWRQILVRQDTLVTAC